jgi:hypothetical protein
MFNGYQGNLPGISEVAKVDDARRLLFILHLAPRLRMLDVSLPQSLYAFVVSYLGSGGLYLCV